MVANVIIKEDYIVLGHHMLYSVIIKFYFLIFSPLM